MNWQTCITIQKEDGTLKEYPAVVQANSAHRAFVIAYTQLQTATGYLCEIVAVTIERRSNEPS